MIFVAADCEFEKDQEQKIKNWNEVVSNDDEVIVFGKFYGAALDDYAILLKKLNGTKIIVDSKSQYYNTTQLKACGFARVININGFIPTADDIDFETYVIIDPELLNIKLHYCIATASSFLKEDKVFSDNVSENTILSVSFKYWDNTPIEYYQIPYIIKNLKD